VAHLTLDRHVIDTMQSVCLMEAGVNASGSLEEDTTLMGLTFGGYLRSKVNFISIWKSNSQLSSCFSFSPVISVIQCWHVYVIDNFIIVVIIAHAF